MENSYRPAIPCDQSEEFAKHQARIREALRNVLDVLKREPRPDTFLGRQHYDLIPLPHEQE